MYAFGSAVPAQEASEDSTQAPVLQKRRMNSDVVNFNLVPPRADEAEAISALLTVSAPDCISLSKAEVLAHLSEFEVVRHGSAGVIATSAMRPIDKRRAEIRSIAVHPDWQGCGLGKLIVRRALFRALQKELRPVCVTRRPGFFSQMGFREIPLGSILFLKKKDLSPQRPRTYLVWLCRGLAPLESHPTQRARDEDPR
jgi:N-acetylglutamate synthase-like GNAT family acetyltransferase